MSRPTPEERLALVELHLTTDGERWREVVHRKDALRLMQEHAAAEVDAATASCEKLQGELRDQRNAAQQDAQRVRANRDSLDCQFAGAFGETDGASHCPAEHPCQRCTLERERDEARAEVERVRAVVFGRDGKSPVLAVGHNHTTRCWADGMNEAMERVREALAPVRKRAAVAPEATEVGRD